MNNADSISSRPGPGAARRLAVLAAFVLTVFAGVAKAADTPLVGWPETPELTFGFIKPTDMAPLPLA